MGEVIHTVGNTAKKVKNLVIWIVVALIAIILISQSFVIVEAGHTGVVTTFGEVSADVLTEGLHAKIPFVQKVIIIDNRVLKTDVESTSASKDLQTIYAVVSLNYRVRNDQSANIYKNVGVNFDNVIVKPAVQECVKSITAKFTAEELITNRPIVSAQMEEALAEKINPYGLDIEVFNIINFEFSEEFNAAIEAKQTAQQQALKAEQDLARVKIEAEQTVEKARAEAEAYRLKSQEITEQMLRMEYINKWDGRLPTVVSDGTNILDIGGMLDSGNTPTGNNNTNANSETDTQE